jgi:lysophospholipase L1-like esterase
MKRASRQAKRMMVIVAVGVSLIVLVLVVKYFWFQRPVGSGPAGPEVRRELFGKVWSAREVLLLGLGDSVTAGFGATRGHSYFDRLVANPADEFPDMIGVSLSAVFPKLKSRNLSVSGTTSIQHIEQQLPKLDETYADSPGIVVMTTGGNDIIHDYGRSPACEGAMYGASTDQARPWIDAFEKRLGDMIDHIHGAFPQGCNIFLANIYDPTDGVGDIESAGLPPWPDGPAILRAYNEVIARCAATRPFVHLVDMHGAFLGHGIHCTQVWRAHYRWHDPHYWYYYNLEDPNDRGYDAIRRLFLLKMAEVFAPKADRPDRGMP